MGGRASRETTSDLMRKSLFLQSLGFVVPEAEPKQTEKIQSRTRGAAVPARCALHSDSVHSRFVCCALHGWILGLTSARESWRRITLNHRGIERLELGSLSSQKRAKSQD